MEPHGFAWLKHPNRHLGWARIDFPHVKNLHDFRFGVEMDEKRRHVWGEFTVVHIAIQLATVVAHVHSRNVAHMDIKLENIIVDHTLVRSTSTFLSPLPIPLTFYGIR
jgi:serine/threonine protein kinase